MDFICNSNSLNWYKRGLVIDDPYGRLNLGEGRFDDENKSGKEDNVRENNLWLWEDVPKHRFRRVVVIYN